MKKFGRCKRLALWGAACLSLLVLCGPAHPGLDDYKLGVYSLSTYGTYNTEEWKVKVFPGWNNDPYGLFWHLMVEWSQNNYIREHSVRCLNQEVNIYTIFPVPGSLAHWNQFDMMFFFGHNNMVTPPHNCYVEEAFWTNNYGVWEKISGNWCDWGTWKLPYEYLYTDFPIGSGYPGAVVYLWEPFTSVLLGYHYRTDVPYTIQKTAQDEAGGNTPGTTVDLEGGLGGTLKWLIFHGCQAVIVTDKDGSKFLPIGIKAFRRTWAGFHLILGHYKSYPLTDLGDLQWFADALKAGMPVQAAYFMVEPSYVASAISAEYFDSINNTDTLTENQLAKLLETSYMNTDTFDLPKPNLTKTPNLWVARWVKKLENW